MITALKKNASLTFYQPGGYFNEGIAFENKQESIMGQRGTFAAKIGNTVGTMATQEAVVSMVAEYNNSIMSAYNALTENMVKRGLVYKNNELWSKRGYMAEEWHAGTYNLDAAINKTASFAKTDKSTANGSADITYDGNKTAGLKYCKDANASVKAQTNPKYADQTRVIPSDQLESGKRVLDDMIWKDNIKGRKEAEEIAENTKSKLADRIVGDDGTSSTPLSMEDANTLAKAVKEDGSADSEAIKGVLKKNGIDKKLSSAKIQNELKGLGKAALVGAGIGFAIGFTTFLAKQGICPDSLKYALAEGGKVGVTVGVQSASVYGISQTIGATAASALKGFIQNAGVVWTENISKMCNMGVVGVLTIGIFSLVEFTKMLHGGENLKSSVIQTGKQALFSLSILAVSIVAQGIWGGAAGMVVSVSAGIIIVTYSVVETVHQRKFADRLREYLIEKNKPIIE